MEKKQRGIWNPPVRYLIYLFLLFPVFVFRDFTPNHELKYISIVEEARQNHTWFTFYNHGEIYADKPPLYFWLIRLTGLLTGDYAMWAVGLFSLLPAIGVLAIMDKWIRISNVRPHPVASNLLLLTTAMFAGGMMIGRMDMLMTFFIVLSLYTFFRIYKQRHTAIEKELLPVYIFLAVFSKGPMGFLIPVTSIYIFLFYKRKIRCAGRYFGLKQWGVLLGLCVVWFGCIYLEGGNEYLGNLLFKQTIGRGVNSFHHQEPVWFYFPRMIWSFAPWVLLYIVLLWKGVRKRMFYTEIRQFFAIVIISNLVVLSLVSSKIDIYLLPLYPFIVYLSSSFLIRNRNSAGIKICVGIPAAICTLGIPGYIIAQKYISPYDPGGFLLWLAIGLLTAGGVAALLMLYRNKVEKAIGCVAGGMLAMIFVTAFTLPRLNCHIGFREMADAAKARAESEQIKMQYAYYGLNMAANMDVFLHQSLIQIRTIGQLDSLDALPHNTIVFLRTPETQRDDALKTWMADRKLEWSTRKYGFCIIGKGAGAN